MSERIRMPSPRFTVITIPHDGCLLHERRGIFCVPAETIRFYHDQMRDKYVGCLAPDLNDTEGAEVRFHFSRLLCDAERRNGPEEIMEKYGMGIWYGKAYDGTVINRHPRYRQEYFRYYQLYHSEISRMCETHRRVFLIDLHSYHDVIIPSDFLVPGRKTPDLCIGTDPKFTPPAFLDAVRRRFEEIGLTVDVNYPYSGCYIPEIVENGSCRCDFIGLMLEFHRRVYLAESGNTDPGRGDIIQETIRRIIRESGEF